MQTQTNHRQLYLVFIIAVVAILIFWHSIAKSNATQSTPSLNFSTETYLVYLPIVMRGSSNIPNPTSTLTNTPTSTSTTTSTPTSTNTPTSTSTPTSTNTTTPTNTPTPTPTPTNTPTPTGTPSHNPNVFIEEIFPNPMGDPLDEYIQIRNGTSQSVVMTGWFLREDDSSNIFTFPTFTLTASNAVKVWTKSGTDTSTNLYWGSSLPIWDDTSDCAYLRNAERILIDSLCY